MAFLSSVGTVMAQQSMADISPEIQEAARMEAEKNLENSTGTYTPTWMAPLDSVSEKLTADSLGSYLPPESTLPKPLTRPSVGLVLSGGGAKGIAHVGVIKALEDNDIPIDYVTGTSMGAIVGSFYACGWSPERMLELFTSKDFLDWSAGVVNPDNKWYFYSKTATPKWVEFNINFDFRKRDELRNQLIPTSLISPIPMNIEFLRLYAPYTEQCDENFNKLFVPYRCVASDVYHKHKVVFGEGSLGDAVRASMSFPLVYRPIEINGVLLYDGGIYDNFPVNVMHEQFNPDLIIGVCVASPDKKPQQGNMYSQVEDMIIQDNNYNLPADLGIKIQIPLTNYQVLQFNKARTIYEIGYKTGLSMVDSIKKRTTARIPLAEVTARRDSFARHTPRLMFDSIQVEGVEGGQARYLKYLFTRGEKKPFGMDQAKTAYYRAVNDGSLSNLVPQFILERDGNTILKLDATPRRPWTLGMGGFVTTSTNSMLYVSAAYHTLSLNSLELFLRGWVGQAYFAGELGAKFSLRTRIPSYVELIGVLSKQRYYDNEVLFYKYNNPMFISEIDNFIRAGYVWAMGQKMRGYVRLGAGYMSDTYFPGQESNYEGEERDKLQYKIGVLRIGVDANSFDNQMYPSEGMKFYANVDLSAQSSRFVEQGDFSKAPRYKSRCVASAEVYWKQFFSLSQNWKLGTMANALATLQRLDQNYTNTLIHAPAFAPTPSTKNYFNVAFRSDNYFAAGLIPIWQPIGRVQVRGDFYGYLPIRELRNNGPKNVAHFEGWFHKPEFIGELAVIVNLPFASISAYVNYLSAPAHNWNFGLCFGLLFQAPKLLRHM